MSTKSSGEAEASSPKPKGGEESEEESEVLEESPCGRWQKRREEVRVLNCFIGRIRFSKTGFRLNPKPVLVSE